MLHFQGNPQVFVANRALGIQRVQKLPGRVVQADDPRGVRGPVDVDVENRQENPDPYGRPPHECIVVQRDHFGDRAVGRRYQQSCLGGHHTPRIAKEIQDKRQQHARHNRQVPMKPAPHDRQGQQRQAHQLQLRQTPASKG